MIRTLHSHSVEETMRFAAEFADLLKPGDRLALQGDLGSGKTTFSKGMISRLTAVPFEEISSPTFTLVEEYRAGEAPVYHVDLYRMDRWEEAEDLPWDEIFSPEAIALIEWPERLPRLFPYCQYHLTFIKQGLERRVIEVAEPKGKES